MRLVKYSKCLIFTFLTLFVCVQAEAEQWTEKRVEPVYELLATKTLISIDTADASQDGSEGWAVFCEGDPPTEFHCSNQFRAYGCSESCNCCYYEEFMKTDDRQKIQDYVD